MAPEQDLIMTWPDASRTTARCQRDGRVGLTCPVSGLTGRTAIASICHVKSRSAKGGNPESSATRHARFPAS